MSKSTRMRLLLLLNIAAVVGLILAIGYAHRPPFYLRVTRETPAQSALTDPDVVALCRSVQSDLANRRFDALEATERSLVDLKERFRGGQEKLVEFYQAIWQLDCSVEFDWCPDETAYPARIREIEDWLSRNPRQTNAWIAMAMTWQAYAWTAQHCRSRDAVTFDDWQTFYDRMHIARDYLDGIDARGEPEFFLAAISILRDSGGSRADLDALFAQGHRAYPRFFTLVGLYATILDPGFYGSDGEVGTLADAVLTDPGGDDGEVAYAFAARAESWRTRSLQLFRGTGLSWSRTKAGLALIEKRYGNSNLDWNVAAFMAMEGEDRPAALEAYRHFGQNWDPLVWGNADYFYNQALAWITYGQ